MSHLAIGHKPGFGPVVAVVRDDSAEWTTIPVTDYSKFFISTEGQDLSYIFDKYFFSNGFNESDYPVGSSSVQGNAYSIDGNPLATSKRGVTGMPVQFVSSSRNWGYCEIFERFPELGGIIPIFEIKLIDQNGRVKIFDFDGADGNKRLFSIGTMYNSVINYVEPVNNNAVYAGNAYNKLHNGFNFTGWCGRATNYSGPANSYVVLNVGDTYRLLSCQWDLPANNAPLPFPNAAPVPGQEVVRISGSEVKVARRGLTVDTTNPRGLQINSNKAPMMCVMMGTVPIMQPGTTYYYPNTSPIPLHETMFLDPLLKYDGFEYSIPPVDPSVSRSGKECRFYYRIDPNGITFWNEGNYAVGCKFMVYATSIEGNTSGGNQVLRRVFNDVQIKRPGSNDANPSSNDILLDTRFPSVRILKQDWIPISAFSPANSLNNLFGTHAAIVPFENHAGMFLFPKVVGNWPKMMAQGYYRSLRPPNVVQWRTSNYCMTTVVETNRMVIHMSPGAPTDVRADTGFEDSMPDPIGVRYYVLGATQL